MDGSVDPPTAEHALVGGVNDGVDRQPRDVADVNLDSMHAKQNAPGFREASTSTPPRKPERPHELSNWEPALVCARLAAA
jgi:hypothetical protein